MLFWLLITAYGLYMIVQTRELIGPGLWVLVLGTIVAWLFLNFFGLFQNAKMRSMLERILGADTDLPKPQVFVGFTTPRYTGLVDAHEDVGFLCFGKQSLLFASEFRVTELERTAIRSVSFQPNVHSLVGLGRWICIEGVAGGKPVRMLIEPRERRTMLGNLVYGGVLIREIRRWVAGQSIA
jgi:hypothetical protein